MRNALAGLTFRGRCFVAAAVASGMSALLLGEKDLIQIALLLSVLPLIAVIMVSRAKYQITCTRVLNPRRTSVGTAAQVELRLENLSRVPSDTILLEEHLPTSLGPHPRVVLERLSARKTSTVTYTVRADKRGRYLLGPLYMQVSDPFRMCTLTHYFPSEDHLTVIPPITPLPELSLTSGYAGSRESHSRSVAVHGHDDAATREYRYGDDLRRVHWRSTARIGELMVRREEQPWEPKATILLDTRASAHIGAGPDSSFEWMVSAAASISMHLRGSQYKLRLISDTGTDIESSEIDGENSLLTYLAEVQPGPRGDIGRLAERVGHRIDEGLVIAILGRIGPEEARLLSGLGRTGSTRIAFLVNQNSWTHSTRALPTAEDQAHQAAALSLVNAGWRITDVERRADISALWPQATQRNQGFAYRAALAETITRRARP